MKIDRYPKQKYKAAKIILVFLVLLASTGLAQNDKNISSPAGRLSLELKIPEPPKPVTVNGRKNLVYELRVMALTGKPVCVGKLEIFNPKTSDIIAVFEREELKKRFWGPDIKSGPAGAVVINPENPGLFYLELVLPEKKAPRFLTHRVSYRICGDDATLPAPVEGAEISVVSQLPVVLGPPLRGGPWAAVYDPAWERGHRRVVFETAGAAHIPGRFAIDFIKLDETGRFAAGDSDLVKNWYGYESEVLAVADGVVSTTRDDFSESATLAAHPKYPSEMATGNYISLKLAENRYVFYEHLKPGSIRVKPGQKIKKGMVIANLGFTGQSTGPHLHLHVADTDSPLSAEGLPFVFEKFNLIGSYPDFSIFGNAPWQSTDSPSDRRVKKERPPAKSVINFN